MTNMSADEGTLSTRYGSLSVPPGDEDLITTFLRRDGEWAFLEAEFLASQLPPRARVLDIGAYLGTFTLGLGQLTQLSFACLVEGNPENLPYLQRNVAANLHCQREVLGAVVVDPARPIVAPHGDPANRGSVSFSSDTDGATLGAVPRDTVGLEALLSRYEEFNLVKADVEGMEEQLLASCPALLQQESTLVWVECNETPRSLSLARLLLGTGRPLTYFAWPSHNPRNHRGNTVPILPFAYEAGLLLGAREPRFGERLREAGCILRPIGSPEDLRRSMWLTPRWAPRDWLDLGSQEVVGIAGHLQSGVRFESFLLSGIQEDVVAPLANVESSLWLAQRRIRQLEDKVAELAAELLQQPRTQRAS